MFSFILCVRLLHIAFDIHTAYLFNSLPLAEKVGVQNAWIIFAAIVVAFLIPVVLLMFFGAHLRSLPSQSLPKSARTTYPVDAS